MNFGLSIVTWRRGAILVLAASVGMLAAGAITVLVGAPLLGYRFFAVESNSMSPAIVRGDLVVTRPASAASVEAGDVVVFNAGGAGIPTVHRVLGKNEIEFAITDRSSGERTSTTEFRLVTKGDNNPAPDSQEVTGDRLLGEVWFTIPDGGSLAGWPVRMILTGLFVGVITVWAAWELAHLLRARTRRAVPQ
ncbi:MAG: signal peptidase I [Dehalococcoidia bacterium]